MIMGSFLLLIFFVYAICVASVSQLLVSTPEHFFVNDSAVSFSWEQYISNSAVNIASYFDIEMAVGLSAEDYVHYARVPVNVPVDFSNNTYMTMFTASGLRAISDYRFRVVPIFKNGRGTPSFPCNVTTLKQAVNFWEPVLGRRQSLSSSARGFTNPVVDRPHLDTGVESWDARVSENDLRYSDPTTSETPVLPSGRRGHTVSTILDRMFMFGGRTNGYTCSNVYKDLINLGTTQSGLYIYPCIYKQGEVNELWSFDLNTYQWIYLNTSKWGELQPPAREQHSSVVVDGDLYVHGGKARIFMTNPETGEILTNAANSDIVYSDLWRLSVPRPLPYALYAWPTPSSGNSNNDSSFIALIPQTTRYRNTLHGWDDAAIMEVSHPADPRQSYCIDKVTVKVTITHTCLKQLYVSILGPGQQTGSPNYFASSSDNEVLLFRKVPTAGGGCVSGTHTYIFDDEATREPEKCCVDEEDVGGYYKPQGKLGEFIGASMSANWTIVVQDLALDTLEGTLDSWEIDFVSTPCMPTYEWHDLSSATYADGSLPVARYGSYTMQHNQYIFVFGGRDSNGSPISDLQRFDTIDQSWTQLTPVNFDVALTASSSVKNNLMLTSWGLVRFGGYYRQPSMPLTMASANYDNSVFLCDPVTMKWSKVNVEMNSLGDTTFGSRVPAGRYLSATTFVSTGNMRWSTALTHEALYNNPIKSMRSNYQGIISDSILLFGGFDGTTSSAYDGSSGGFYNDMWMLRLSNWSTAGTRHIQENYRYKHCSWRTGRTAQTSDTTLSTYSCLGVNGTNTTDAIMCDFRDLLMLSWCEGVNQTIA